LKLEKLRLSTHISMSEDQSSDLKTTCVAVCEAAQFSITPKPVTESSVEHASNSRGFNERSGAHSNFFRSAEWLAWMPIVHEYGDTLIDMSAGPLTERQ
jgi:hypothetical protein